MGKFYQNTDTVDIGAQSTGVHLGLGYINRGLCIQIKHNRVKELGEASNLMAQIIVKALNEAIEKGELKLP